MPYNPGVYDTRGQSISQGKRRILDFFLNYAMQKGAEGQESDALSSQIETMQGGRSMPGGSSEGGGDVGKAFGATGGKGAGDSPFKSQAKTSQALDTLLDNEFKVDPYKLKTMSLGEKRGMLQGLGARQALLDYAQRQKYQDAQINHMSLLDSISRQNQQQGVQDRSTMESFARDFGSPETPGATMLDRFNSAIGMNPGVINNPQLDNFLNAFARMQPKPQGLGIGSTMDVKGKPYVALTENSIAPLSDAESKGEVLPEPEVKTINGKSFYRTRKNGEWRPYSENLIGQLLGGGPGGEAKPAEAAKPTGKTESNGEPKTYPAGTRGRQQFSDGSTWEVEVMPDGSLRRIRQM